MYVFLLLKLFFKMKMRFWKAFVLNRIKKWETKTDSELNDCNSSDWTQFVHDIKITMQFVTLTVSGTSKHSVVFRQKNASRNYNINGNMEYIICTPFVIRILLNYDLHSIQAHMTSINDTQYIIFPQKNIGFYIDFLDSWVFCFRVYEIF